MGSRPEPEWILPVVALVAALTVAVSTTTAQAADGAGLAFTAKALTPSSVAQTSKSSSGQLAKSDQSLLQREDSVPVTVLVKLDYDAAASYTGGIKGLAPTSPSVTGRPMTGSSAQEDAYAGYTEGIEASFRSALATRVPAAKAGGALRTVYGGLAVRLPAKDAKVLATLPGVAAVQADRLQKPASVPGQQQPAATTEAPEFVGAAALWRRLGGQDLAGRGVVFADIDTGVWPEHPFLAENPALGAPPAPPSGQPRPCGFGDNPLTRPPTCSGATASSSAARRSSTPTTPSSAARPTRTARGTATATAHTRRRPQPGTP